MTIKRYSVDCNDMAEVIIEIDHDVATEEKLHEINDFWSNSEQRIGEARSVLGAVLKMLTAKVLYLALEDGFAGVESVIRSFDYEIEGVVGHEGWPKLDGSYGIKLIDFTDLTIDYDDMTVREVV